MNTVLRPLGNVPATTSVIASLFPRHAAGNKKVAALEQTGEILRLKRGLYVVSPTESQQPLSTELIANHLYAPSYLSMHTALRYYGLIPERVHRIQSMTLKSSRRFENALGHFDYLHISREAFSIGLRQERSEGTAFVIASPEKALCDLIANTPGLNLRYVRQMQDFLADDLRLDMEAFAQMDPSLFAAYAQVGKKGGAAEVLLKLLER